MAVIVYMAMRVSGKPGSSSPGRGQAIPEGVWMANIVPVFNGSTQGVERQ